MTYKLTFLESAKKEWDKLSPDLQQFFKAKLSKILEQPHIPKNKLIIWKGVIRSSCVLLATAFTVLMKIV